MAGIPAAHDTAKTLFQIKPTSYIRKPLKSEVNLKRISSISLPCQDSTEFSTNKVIYIPENFDVSDGLLSLENLNDQYKENFVNKCFVEQQFNSRNKYTYLGWDELTLNQQKFTNNAHGFLTIHLTSCYRFFNCLHRNE